MTITMVSAYIYMNIYEGIDINMLDMTVIWDENI